MLDSPFLKTGPSSWAETDLTAPPRVQPGDRPAGAAPGRDRGDASGPRSRRREGEPRMVVLSSPYLATNPYLEIDPANLDLLMNAVQWLRGRSDSLGVAPKVHNAMRFTADPNLRARLHLVPTILAVVLIVGFGVTTYLARRVLSDRPTDRTSPSLDGRNGIRDE